jgi:rubrerythrin
VNRSLAVLYIRAMTRELTAFEVLEVAEQMERDAARFYRKAAALYRDPSMSKLFSELAQWEKRHIQVFADMKGRFPEQAWEMGRFDLDRVSAARLDVPPAVFDEHSDPAKELAGNETRSEVFNLALKKERYTIGYYTALTEFALGEDNIRVIKDILQEEKKHVRILVQSLKQATG